MATLILLRHGRTTANAAGTLAGRTAGVRLDQVGVDQAGRAGERIAAVPLALVATSPLERCRQTAKAVLAAHPSPPELVVERGVIECDYGTWQGRQLSDLAKEAMWSTVQTQPSAAHFPEGESLSGMQARAVAAVRRLDARLEAEHGSGAVGVVVSHGDIIKSVLADALGMHLDLFQRISVDPASISIVRYTGTRPYVLASNTHAGDLGWLTPPPAKKTTRRRGRRPPAPADTTLDAAVGGGAGPAGAPL